MNKIIENVAALIKVKTLITVVVVGVFSWLAIKGDISPEQVVTMAGMVVSFYFGTQAEKKGGLS
jgi:hypothetical protein